MSLSIQFYLLPILILFASGKDLTLAQGNLSYELTQISLWLKISRLSLHIKKTIYMLITNKKRTPNHNDLQIEGECIHELCKITFLGLIMDNKLNCKDHISDVWNKIVNRIGNDIESMTLFEYKFIDDTVLFIHIFIYYLLQSYLG